VPNDKGKIPLHYAAREGRTEMVQFLLRADPKTASIRSKKDKLALHFACGEGHLEVVSALLSVDPEERLYLLPKASFPYTLRLAGVTFQ
jgi:ankyrin repeat protein